MIKNLSEILSQSTIEMEDVFKNSIENFVCLEQEGTLNIQSSEEIIGTTIKSMIAIVLNMAGSLLSNINEQDNCECNCCRKKLRINQKLVPITLMTLYGKLAITRNEIHCRHCGIGRGINDEFLQINKKHRMTNGLVELVTYVGQLIASFEEGKETIKKFLGFMGVEVSASQIQDITKEIGEKVYKKDKEKAEGTYEKPEETIPDLLKKKKRKVLHIHL